MGASYESFQTRLTEWATTSEAVQRPPQDTLLILPSP